MAALKRKRTGDGEAGRIDNRCSRTLALPVTNIAAARDVCFQSLPLEIREQIYGYLIDHLPVDEKSGIKPGPAGNIIFRLNSLHSAILYTNHQVRNEALQVFYRDTIWRIKIPAASILPRSPYCALGSIIKLQQYPFFKHICHITLEFMMAQMHDDMRMGRNGASLLGRQRAFNMETDMVPRQLAVRQIANALLHASALRTVAIHWSDIVGWGEWKDKVLVLRPLGKLPVTCVIEKVYIEFAPKMGAQYYGEVLADVPPAKTLDEVRKSFLDSRALALEHQESLGREWLGQYLAYIKRREQMRQGIV